jgi:signal peptidase I
MRAVLSRGVPFRFRARGGSMHPFVRDGDVVTVQPLGKSRIGAGDIVAFTHPGAGRLVVHRVAAGTGRGLLMKGDNAEYADGIVPLENVLGRVSRVERDGRRIRLGVGPERALIAWLSRSDRLETMLAPARWVYRKIWKR